MKRSQIELAVNNFFGRKRVVYATPGTDNHSANFYGDHHICKLTRRDVIACIQVARDGWTWDDEQDAEESAIEAVLDDLQFDRPRD